MILDSCFQPCGLGNINKFVENFLTIRPLVKSAYQKNNFLISQPKHMLWVLKRTVSMGMGKKIFTILR